MRPIIIIIFILVASMLHGCSTTMYQPLITSLDNAKIKSTDYISKQKIAINYTGVSPIYNKFDIKNYNFIKSDGKEKLTEMGGATASSNMPISTNYALVDSLSNSFNQVTLVSKKETNDLNNYYILNYEIKKVDFSVNVYKNDSFFAMPYESGAEATVTIIFELSKNGGNISKGIVSGHAKDKNTKDEHEKLESGAYKLLSQSASLLALAGSIKADGASPDANSKTRQGTHA